MHDGLIAPRNGNRSCEAGRAEENECVGIVFRLLESDGHKRLAWEFREQVAVGHPHSAAEVGAILFPFLPFLGGALVFPGLSGKTLVSLTCQSRGDRESAVSPRGHSLLGEGVWGEGEGARARWGGWEAEMGRRIGRAQVSVEGFVRARSRV